MRFVIRGRDVSVLLFIMVKGILLKVSQATSKTGQPYCSLKLKTLENELVVNVWNSTSDKFKVFKLVTISNEKVSDQGISCTISDIKFSEIKEEYLNLVPLPPTHEEWSYLVGRLGTYIEDSKQRDFFLKQAGKLYGPYSKAPAAKSNHHAFPGGLLLHTYQMLKMYSALMDSLPFTVNPFIVSTCCLFHDYLKLAEYSSDNYDYQPVMFLKGHVVGSAEVLGAALRKEGFDETLTMHCQHVILAHHGRTEWGSPVEPATTEAFLVHHLDMLSGHGVMFEETPNGEKNYGLGRTIFHYN